MRRFWLTFIDKNVEDAYNRDVWARSRWRFHIILLTLLIPCSSLVWKYKRGAIRETGLLLALVMLLPSICYAANFLMNGAESKSLRQIVRISLDEAWQMRHP